jgi:hypothetical protein
LKKKILVLVSLEVALAMTMLVVVSCQNATTAETSAAGSTVAETSAAGTTVAEASDSSVVAGDQGACADCHNSSTQIVSKDVQYSASKHAIGGTFFENRAACAVCHTSEGFTARIDAKATLEVATDAADIANASPINCRTCHNIHDTYTKADWSLARTDAVTLELTGDVYDKGNSNLCVSCHQPRISTPMPVAGADIEITSARYGPHYGPQSSMLLGVGGYGEYKGSNVHYDAVDEGCITCHMTDTAVGDLAGGHTMKVAYEEGGDPLENLTPCLTCHEDIESFDRNGVQTENAALVEEVRLALVKKGLIVPEFVEGEIPMGIPGTFTADQAGALWNYKTVLGDKSMGIHNPGYTKFLLETALELLKK